MVLWGICHLHFTDEEVRAQRSWKMCSSSYNQEATETELELKNLAPNSRLLMKAELISDVIWASVFLGHGAPHCLLHTHTHTHTHTLTHTHYNCIGTVHGNNCWLIGPWCVLYFYINGPRGVDINDDIAFIYESVQFSLYSGARRMRKPAG
jgi:hypothetical protein